ncbi:MAG TPA: SMP-30/gluconolactonase/LRE family protein [Candidatus Limnocylindria bacterium]|nr:SMP-30/gluconolactonase/LRE family protein [Candidatus Limnocylindria bacterium]
MPRLFLPLAGLLAAGALMAADNPAPNPYPPGPDSLPQAGVPKGERIRGVFTAGTNSVFPGTVRDYTVYLPQQLDRSKPAPVMVLQDGGGYRAETVFDNLIAKREIPALVGIFVTPGRVKARSTNALDRFNRSLEYDGLGDAYARFLLNELFPFIEQQHGLRLTTNADERAIGGGSSGAIAAFTAAWERPDAFHRVFSSIGTYVGLRGGNSYPTLIRKTEPKPIRIFLQDGENDQNIYGGDWWMANQEMERALQFAGYDVNHAWGTGAHDGYQATQVFPDALRWLWRDYPAPVVANPEHKSKQPLVKEILADGEGWQLVQDGFRYTEGPAVNTKGEVFFSDIPNNRIHRIGLDGRVSLFAENTGGANGLMFGPDGRLYACANGKKQIVAYDDAAKPTVIADGLESNDLCLAHNGNLYVTDPDHKKVWLITPDGRRRVVDEGVRYANGVRLSPDQSLLYVADTQGQFVWSYVVAADGSLESKQKYYHLHLADGATGSSADGLALDTKGNLYVATELGVQYCDQAGRVNGIIPKPQNRWLAHLAFGGPNFDVLYAFCSDKVYRRKTLVHGVRSAEPPIKPPAPHL